MSTPQYRKPDDLYNLNLHGQLEMPGKASAVITRVPGGWVYCFFNQHGASSSCFVPINREFRTTGPHVDLRVNVTPPPSDET